MSQSKTPGIKSTKHNSKFKVPDGLWTRCEFCQAILEQSVLENSFRVCTECGHHFRVKARKRIEYFCDANSFKELDQELMPKDHLKFYDSKPYTERLKAAQNSSGSNDAFISGEAKLLSKDIQFGIFDFDFMGGSMGTVVGEKAARVFDRAYEKKQPAVIFHASGGARMQEGLLSLMQMAKTVVALSRLNQAGIPYISVLTHPTTGGVAASFAILGDVNLAEPKSLICFAGPRVIEQTIKQKLPEGFQRAEFLMEHGMIDQVVHRKDLRQVVNSYLELLC